MNFIDKFRGNLTHSAVAVVVAGVMVIAPAAVFANNDNQTGVTVPVTNAAPQVNIGVKGNVTVKNATVTGVNGSTITATTQWGSNSLTWTITSDGSTEFLFRGGKKATLATVTAGDILNFNGALASTSGLTVAAKTVRDLSKEKPVVVVIKHTIEGKLTTAIGTTSLPTSFMLTSGSTNYIVNVPVGTPILSKNWASITLGTLVVGDTVRVYGSTEASSTNTIDAVVVRDATR